MDRNFNGPLIFNVQPVALRKESVDRNFYRRCMHMQAIFVALRKESVDRNRKYLFLEAVSMGRSPQGERG